MTGKEAARLFVSVGADTSQFQSGMRGVQSSLNQTAGAVNNTMGMFKQFALGQIVGTYALQGLNAALGFGKDAIIGFNANLEQANIGFTTMLGSAEAATKMLNDLKSFAAATPFRFEGLLDSSKRLLAMGYAAEEIIPIMTTVGDTVAGLGAGEEGIQRATYALGQMKTAGRVLSQDMMQLTSLGVPAWQYLADAVGGTTAEVRKMVEQGLVPADAGIQAILAGMQQDFGGLMAKQAKTFNGAMSNVMDMLQQIVAGGFQPFFEEVSKAALAVATFLQSSAGIEVMNNMKTIVQQVVDVMKQIVPVVLNVIGAIAGFVAANPWIMGVVGALIAMRIALFALSIVGAVVGWIQGLIMTLGALRAAFLVNGVSGFVTTLGAAIPSIGIMAGALTGAATAAWGFTAALLANPLTWIVLAIVGVTAGILALAGAFDQSGDAAERSAQQTTKAWGTTYSYLEEQNSNATRYAAYAGAEYGAQYASGIAGTGPAAYAAGASVSGEAAKGLVEQGTPKAAAAGQIVGATFGKEMQSAAMVAFRAGERDISGVTTATADTYLKELQAAFAKLNFDGVKNTVTQKLQGALAINPAVLRGTLMASIGGLSSGLQGIAMGAINDIYRARVNEKFAASLKPKKRAIYEGLVELKTQMVNGAQEAVAAAKTKLDEFKQVLANLKDKMKSYAADIKQTLMSGLSLKSIDMKAEFDDMATEVISSVTTFKNGIAKTVANISFKPMLKDANYVVDQFKQRVEKMKSFITNLQNLRKLGLNATVLKDIMGMGVEEGGAMAAALAEGGKASIDTINALQKESDALAQAFGNAMGQMEFGGQIAAAEKDVAKANKDYRKKQDELAEAIGFDPIAETLKLIKKGSGGNANAAATPRTTNTSTSTSASVTVQNLNVSLPTVAGYGAGEQAMERANAARIAQEVAKALGQITMVANNGYILK